jgi:hypothetical protein
LRLERFANSVTGQLPRLRKLLHAYSLKSFTHFGYLGVNPKSEPLIFWHKFKHCPIPADERL